MGNHMLWNIIVEVTSLTKTLGSSSACSNPLNDILVGAARFGLLYQLRETYYIWKIILTTVNETLVLLLKVEW